jgi:hypothetical protein
MDVLAAYALDHGDIDIVYGRDTAPATEAPSARLLSAGREWLWRRLRGYPSLHERKQALMSALRLER